MKYAVFVNRLNSGARISVSIVLMIAFSFLVSVSCLEADQKEVSFALAPGVVIISSSDLFFDNSLETEVSFTTTLRYVVVFLPTKLADSFPKGARSATNLSFDRNQ